MAVARCEADPILIEAGPIAAPGFAVGHETIARVLATDADVSACQVGDLVACSFQVSCGQCPACSAGRSAACARYPLLSDYGMQPLSGVEYGGMLSDVVLVPHADAMLVPMPADVDLAAVASIADNIMDGYRSVAHHLRERPGADVLIICHGSRSIALYAALSAVALGAASVTFRSDDEQAVAAATSIGVDATLWDLTTRAGRWPVVVDCGRQPLAFLHALDSTESEGVLHTVSYYAEPVAVPLGAMYTRGISLFSGRVQSASALADMVRIVGDGTLDPGRVRPTVIPWSDAADRYLDDALKLVVLR